VRGISKLAAASASFVAIGALMLALAGGAEAAKHGKGPRILNPSQSALLQRGALRVRIPGKARMRLRGLSTTFDDPGAAPLTKAGVRRRARHVVRLKLTAAGRGLVQSCTARTIELRGGKKKPRRVLARAQLIRDTPACSPKAIDLSRASDCDFIGQQQGSLCLLPFPDDYYTVADASTATGRRIDLHSAGMPRNAASVPITPEPYNLNDGFSPGVGMIVRVPGLDSASALQQTDAVPINHLGRFSEPDQPVVVIDATTGQRWPIWVEIDSNAGSPTSTALEIHPAVNFAAGHRYIVAMRNLKDAGGQAIPAPEGFRYYRDQLPSNEAPINAQRPRFESIFNTLRTAGVRRSNLYLAWDFTVASDENIAARELHIRDDAFAALGDTTPGNGVMDGSAPDFQVTQVDNFTSVQDPEVARRVRGTYTVPCYLEPNCGPGGSFDLGPDGLPARNAGNDWTANFDCIIPRSAVDGTPSPGRPAIYGHGLFGSASEVFNADIQQELANTYGFVLCATDEIGMSNSDLGNTANILTNLSSFPQLADRLQQGLLDEIFLGRLMAMSSGFSSDVAFHVDGTTLASNPVIDTSELYYQGSSQGGIMGGALTAVDPDFTRAVLNVPAMNYSVLLPRSVDYDSFAGLLNLAYTDPLERPLLLSLIQMLWDRGEPNGYAHRMTTNPLPGNPAHTVLMNIALGDHQVTNFQSDVEARTIGASTHLPILDPGRWPDNDILWNVPGIASYPFGGSAAIYGDIGPVRPNPSPPPTNIGVPPPPFTNTPNRAGEDPHGAPRGAPLALQLISDFLKPTGAVTNVCGSSPCYAGGYTGP
jgi:hypothetical protein